MDADLKQKIIEILRSHFPEDTVDVSAGHGDNVHVIVVSRKFDQKGEKEKQDWLWSIIDQSQLSDAEKVRISLILPYSPADLK